MTRRLPAEVELIYEVMPCNAMRTVQEPGTKSHDCAYFRKWGKYHSYDYQEDAPPAKPGIVHDTVYVGRAPLIPEVLSGCRKAPVISVGINPNLPGWWSRRRHSVNPLFDSYKQYAHYFRFRTRDKLQIPGDAYEDFGGGDHDTPFSEFELDVPEDENGDRPIHVELQPVSMYEGYQNLLDSLAERMEWQGHSLSVGEDLSYGNMVACPSARWTTRSLPQNPDIPPMTRNERRGIVSECFRERKYFLRQLFQSLPKVILIFSQTTANAFISEMRDRFYEGTPQPGERLADLVQREIRLSYGVVGDTNLNARVIFAPHITGTPDEFQAKKEAVLAHLVEEAMRENIQLNPETGHLRRPEGACVFCPMLDVADCDYADELVPISDAPRLTADSSGMDLLAERQVQENLLAEGAGVALPVDKAWQGTDYDPEADPHWDEDDSPGT